MTPCAVFLGTLFFLSSGEAPSDSLDLEYRRIEAAIEVDSAYSRLYYMDLSRSELRVQTFRFKGFERALSSDTIPKTGIARVFRYRFVYHPMQFQIDDTALPLVPLLVDEIGEEGERGPEGFVGTRRTYRRVFDLKGFLLMHKDYPTEFKTLVADLRKYHLMQKGMPLGSKISRAPEVRSPVAEGNTGYFRYTTSSEGFVGNPHTREPYAIDATWSAVRVSLGFASTDQWLGIHSFGFEMGFGDRVLSLLSYQSPYLAWGGRLLLFFEGKGSRFDSSFFFDVRIRGRSPVKTQRFVQRWKLHKASPIASLDKGLINVTSGAAIELRTGRPFNERMPFFAFYYSGGPKNFDHPSTSFMRGTKRLAYFSTIQWEAVLGYYWYLDDKSYNTIKLDIGAGSYNIWLAELDSLNTARSYEQVLPLTNVKALLAFDFLHDSHSARFGVRTRLFDNRLTLQPWLKIFRNEPHELRLEFSWLTRVFGRSALPWEVEQGSILHVRYRYGL